MATGLPCVASDIGGNQDLLATGPCGLLVPPDDPSAWARALTGLLSDDSLRSRLGAAARRRVDEEFDLARVVDRYVSLYRDLLGRSGGMKKARHAGRA
jgi:glycosyltransferase involved in cell wall biosynthesis